MKSPHLQELIFTLVPAILLACNALIPLPTEEPLDPSGIHGVKTYSANHEDYNHVNSVVIPADNIPPPFGPHFNVMQNCGIYDQPVPVVLTAWGKQLIIESLPDDRIEPFIAYYEQGPQNPEPGAPCSRAIGEPLP